MTFGVYSTSFDLYLTLFSLSQFFNQVLVMGKSSVSDLSEHVFDLIQELFSIDPMLLTSVMPQLEFKLKVNIIHTLARFSSKKFKRRTVGRRKYYINL